MRIGINGFGRIGRQVFRMAFADEETTVARVNDLAEPETLAHLLAFDTAQGTWERDIRMEDGTLVVDGQRTAASAEKDPSALPWEDDGVDVVLESTGVFRRRADAAQHLDAGARRVLVSAPGKTELDGDFVLGVNEDGYDPDTQHVVSIGSCTTNCLAPVVKVLDEEFGLEHGLINTIHAYTASQNLLDGPHKDLRRARAAAANVIPTTTGAAEAIGSILPELDGRLDGLAVRVPVTCASLLDLTCRLGTSVTAEGVNDAMRRWADGRMEGILCVEDRPIVSSDVIGRSHSAIVSPSDTYVTGEGRLVKVLAWYDNEWGFSRRCLEAMKMLA